MIVRILIIAILTGLCPGAHAQQPNAGQIAFERYVAQVEERIREEESSPDSFLSVPMSARIATEAQLRQGQILITKQDDSPVRIPGGLIHHWVGLGFIPDATIAQVLGVLQNYDSLVRCYAPEVASSKLLSRDANDFHIALRLREHKVITIVLDTEYDVHYGQLDAYHQYSVSRSAHITEIADAGEPGEHPLAPGEDHGFLRKLNTYWRFVREANGTFVRCEAISMTRDVPTGLGWLVSPFIQSVPRDSLRFTLTATRNAVLQNRDRN
ncbi:MAG TPA: hypothetical protein VN861_13815 [Candidatus Acidoferrales bacterium]|nr:hypothetical protein [Candidatus Acidoferrales bacterium]